VKRRALLAAVLLMPTSARGQNKPPAKTPAKPPAKAPAKAPPNRTPAKPAPAKPAPAPPPAAGLHDSKTQYIAFNTSAFPYRGNVPETRKPFLDKREGRRLGHTTIRGDVYWEDTTYSDRRSLLHLPAGFDVTKPVLLVVYLHGQGATLERDVAIRQAVPRQLAESGLNVALAAPQLAYDAADSSAGHFWQPGHFGKYIDEAAERLMRLHGDRRLGPALNAAPVVIVAYSGGYWAAAYSLFHGGAGHRVRGVILLDALYGDEDKFATWFVNRRRQSFLFSAYTDSTREENNTLQKALAKHRVPLGAVLPTSLVPGTVAFAPCGGMELHNEFVTRAWQSDPLKHAISLIPGFPRHGKQGA
jgi:hypothetical protein